MPYLGVVAALPLLAALALQLASSPRWSQAESTRSVRVPGPLGEGRRQGAGALRTARIAAVVSAVLVLLSLTLRWWPEDFSSPTFGAHRTEFLDDWGDDSHPWHNYLFWSWFAFGYVLQVLAVLTAPFLVGRRGLLAHGVLAFGVFGCGWQLVGVRGATLINTTMAPYLGPAAGVVLLGAWILGSAGRRETDVARVVPVGG